MTTVLGWVAGAVVMLLSAPAAAAEGTTEGMATETRWYGWQTLAVDAAAATTMIVGVATAPRAAEGAGSLLLGWRAFGEDAPRSTTTLDVGLAMYTLGPAVVHALHGRPLPSVGSATMRAVGPTAGLFVGLAYGLVFAIPVALIAPGGRRHDGPDFGENGYAVLVGGVASGIMLGTIGPIVIDAVALAREPVAKTNDIPKEPPTAIRWQPQLGYTKGGPSVGLAGTF